MAWVFLLNWVDVLAMILPKRSVPKSRKRVIFLKMDGIGDFVIWTATFDALSRIYPSNEFERILVGNDRSYELAKNQDVFDQKIFVNWERLIFSPIYRFRVMRQVRNLDAEIIFNPRLTREFLWSDSIVRCSGAQTRIGSAGLDNQMPWLHQLIGNRVYTQLVAAPARDEHELISHRKFLAAVDPAFKGDLAPPGLVDDIGEKPPIIKGGYAVMFLGAYSVQRIWPIEKFGAVAQIIVEAYGLRMVLCGGPGEEHLGHQFEKSFNGDFVNMIGKTKLPELKRLLESARLVVTNDTSAAHISTVSGTPTVVLTPGNQVGRFFPYPSLPETKLVRQLSVFHEMPCFGCGWTCVHQEFDENKPKPCIERISVEDVAGAIYRLLDTGAISDQKGQN